MCVFSSLIFCSNSSKSFDSPKTVATAFRSRLAEMSLSVAVTVIVSSALTVTDEHRNNSPASKRVRRVFIIVRNLERLYLIGKQSAGHRKNASVAYSPTQLRNYNFCAKKG